MGGFGIDRYIMLFEEYIAHQPSAICLADSPFCLAIDYKPSNGKFLKSEKMGIKKINGFIKAIVENISDANSEKYTKHRNRKTTLSDQILLILAVITMSKALTAMPLRPTKHNEECRPS